MLFFKLLIHSSFPRLLALLSHAFLLTLIHDRIAALAAGPDLTLEGPDQSDYPDDEDISKAFLGVGRGQSVVFADWNGAEAALDFARLRGKKWIYDAFPISSDSQHYMFRNGRSLRWYGDFYERCTRVWLEAAAGWVWLITDFPDGPPVIPSCKPWWLVELPLLKLNDNVRVIVRVSRVNYYKINIFLNKDDSDPFDPKKPGSSNPPGLPSGNQGGLFGIGAGTGLLGGSWGASTGAIGGAAHVGQELIRGLYLPSSDGDDDDDDENDNEDGVKTDVLGDVMGSLPLVNLFAGTTDEQQDMAEKDGALEAPRIFNRQTTTVCYNWINGPDFPPFPDDPRQTRYSLGIEDQQYYDGASDHSALVQVVQYAKSFALLYNSNDYKLDIWIRNPANPNHQPQGQLLGSVIGADAQEGAAVKVLSLLPYALFVSTGATNADPLHFRYGEQEWDSNDNSDEHKCEFKAWTDEKREGSCNFKYG
ncbi:hypothetical protein MMC07_005389 [Pseudocyphellaria aurata]|nr:hypothetical protein [Pseudocyphellaria aurata]